MEFADRTFEGEEVVLDGNSFRNCKFQDVVFVFGGGSLEMNECRIDTFSFRFTGDLANGLYGLYQLFGPEGLIQVIRGFVSPPETVGDPIEL